MDRKKTIKLIHLKEVGSMRSTRVSPRIKTVDSQLNPIGRPPMRLMPLYSINPSSPPGAVRKASPPGASPKRASSSRSSSSRSSSSKHLPPPLRP